MRGERCTNAWAIVAAVAAVMLASSGLTSRAAAQAGGGAGVADASVPEATIETTAASFTTISGRVDHVAAGTGLRNFPSGTIRIRGVLAGSSLVKAYLYWAMICKGTSCPTNVSIEFRGRPVTTGRICTGDQPCWAGQLLGAYRADVTSLMPAGPINGDYEVSNIPTNLSEKDGRDPWSPATTNLPKADGATLIVVYSNPGLPATGRVYIHNGCDGNTGPATVNVINQLSPPAPSPLTFARLTRFGADGQVGASTLAVQDFTNEKTFFLGPVGTRCPTSMPQIAGDGAILDRDSDWNGEDGETLNQLWDTHTSVVHSAGFLEGLLAPGAGNYCVRYVIKPVTAGAAVDCMNFIGYVLGVF